MNKCSHFLLPSLLAIGLIARPQSSNKEFEGRVYFTNQFAIKSPGLDSASVVRSFGASSMYTYKTGRYKWVSYGGDFQYEFYDGIKGLLVDKYGADTLYKVQIEKGDSLVSYTVQHHATTICGYRCDAIQLVLLSGADQRHIKRTVYYAPQLYVNPDHFKPYRDYANDKVYTITQGLPLRIVMEFEGMPVEITMNATKIEQVHIADKELQLDPFLYIK